MELARHARATLIVAPLLLFAGALLHPAHVSASSWLEAAESGRTRFYLAHLLLLAALAALIPAVLALAELAGEAEPRLARRGRALVLLGVLGLAALAGTDLFLWQLVAFADHAVALEAVERIGSSVGVLGPTFLLAAGVGLGFATLALALRRAGVVEPWAAVAIGVALPLALLGFPLGWPAIVAGAASVAGLGSVGRGSVGRPLVCVRPAAVAQPRSGR